ncbi:hypothetical protein H632_c795p1 [Helicosporidium sp. ATCC 50920]|nr:hypothetical protein H632_c795p1 [Helicosporidium sp. ATCC 50920]|eukprot:KDD75232.1 hypothetical protein H632_c795p1 [Helicosporidium sp. ATCC 50920]
MYVAFVDAETDARRSTASGLSPGDARLTPAQVLYFRTAMELVVSSPHADVAPSAGNLPALAARHLLNAPLGPSETAGRAPEGPGAGTQAASSTQGAAPKLTVGEKQALLDRFVRTEWLAEVPGVAGHYTLGVRLRPGAEPCRCLRMLVDERPNTSFMYFGVQVRACMELVPRLIDLPDVSEDVLCTLKLLL